MEKVPRKARRPEFWSFPEAFRPWASAVLSEPGFFTCKGGGVLILTLPAVLELGSDHRGKSTS